MSFETGRGELERKLRVEMRRRGLAIRTEATYVSWYKRFVKYQVDRHPVELGSGEAL